MTMRYILYSQSFTSNDNEVYKANPLPPMTMKYPTQRSPARIAPRCLSDCFQHTDWGQQVPNMDFHKIIEASMSIYRTVPSEHLSRSETRAEIRGLGVRERRRRQAQLEV